MWWRGFYVKSGLVSFVWQRWANLSQIVWLNSKMLTQKSDFGMKWVQFAILFLVGFEIYGCVRNERDKLSDSKLTFIFNFKNLLKVKEQQVLPSENLKNVWYCDSNSENGRQTVILIWEEACDLKLGEFTAILKEIANWN
jgi:hypothetical protein